MYNIEYQLVSQCYY